VKAQGRREPFISTLAPRGRSPLFYPLTRRARPGRRAASPGGVPAGQNKTNRGADRKGDERSEQVRSSLLNHEETANRTADTFVTPQSVRHRNSQSVAGLLSASGTNWCCKAP
jgi:hypothetical protein